jgi:putative ubiquitin-RnfH superfamily antitoxin RatB of RatAB toxin-antitoxin module
MAGQVERIWLDVLPNASVRDCLILSAIEKRCPQLAEQPIEKWKVGIFSKQVALDHGLRDGDQIEIYRPLLIDPKEARRQRVRHKNKPHPLKDKIQPIKEIV